MHVKLSIAKYCPLKTFAAGVNLLYLDLCGESGRKLNYGCSEIKRITVHEFKWEDAEIKDDFVIILVIKHRVYVITESADVQNRWLRYFFSLPVF